MRFGRRKRTAAEAPNNLAELRNWLAAATRSTQVPVVAALVTALRPFGRLDRLVIEPARFDALAAGVLEAVSSGSGASTIVSELELLPALTAEEEPDGAGFFALGAAVELLYAARFAQGDDDAAVHTLSRALDVAGVADDELGTTVMESLVQALCAHAGEPGSVPIPAAILDRLREQARQLQL